MLIFICTCLYYRLGETDKALYHYKQAGPEADPDEVAKVKILQAHLNKCTEARRLGDWNSLIAETNKAISSGADSAPQVRVISLYITCRDHLYFSKKWKSVTKVLRSLLIYITHVLALNYACVSLADMIFVLAFKIFALQAEALLKLRRHQDADNILTKCPNFDVDECTKFFGPIGNANLLVTRAQVDMAAGR